MTSSVTLRTAVPAGSLKCRSITRRLTQRVGVTGVDGVEGAVELAGIEAMDPVELIRPGNHVLHNVPLPTAEVGDPLRFAQLRFFIAQGFIGMVALGIVTRYGKNTETGASRMRFAF